MGLRCVARFGTEHHRWQKGLRASASYGVLTLSAAAMLTGAWADIDAGTTVKQSTLSGTSTTMNGGTLQLDQSTSTTRAFTFNNVAGNTFDVFGSTPTFTGKLTGAGAITITDSKGGGILTLTNSSNDYTGFTTINSGATLALLDSDTTSTTNTDSGSIAHSAQLVNNGTFDISGTVSGASIIALSGSGKVLLGAETLTINDYDSTNSTTFSDPTTFSGTISGTGSLVFTAGTLTLSGVNTYTGSTAISSGTVYLTGNGSIASSSAVFVYGTMDVSAANNPTIKSLAGSGTVVLGNNSLVLTAAGNQFSGVISGNGALVLNSGEEYISGLNTMAGGVIVNGGTLDIGSTAVAYNIANAGTVAFYGSGQIAMSGVISGTGAVSSLGSAVTTITQAQTYSGVTTITGGLISLSGDGSIANSSNVIVNSALDITYTNNGTSLQSLSGSGAVRVGTNFLTITGAGGTFSGTILGTGGLILAGSTQTLSGANTYTGTTTIQNGSLVLASGASLRSTVVINGNNVLDASTGPTDVGSSTIASLTGTGSVLLGRNTLVISNAADTYAGVISGTGGLSISSGTEMLAGANTYSGITTITGGTLALTATGSISSASALSVAGTFDATAASGAALTYASLTGVSSGVVALGAHNLNLANASGTFAGVISGTSGITIGGGTQVLSGVNTYTGGTAIASGATLQLGTGASTGSILGDVVDNGTLAFDRNDSSVFSGVISGAGAVNQIGNGTTILTGANTYSGGTIIDFGTLQIGNNGTSGSITGNITDNGILAFSRSDGTTYTGAISGTGGLSALAGTTVLTGANSYSGATKINSGATLALIGSGSIAGSSMVTSNGIFDVSAATAPNIASLAGTGSVVLGGQTLTLSKATTGFSGVISGLGGLNLTSGSQILSGNNSYTGQTTINGGTLTVTGSIASSAGVTINSGGTLAGTGTVSGLTVKSGGTVSAGSAGSTGTLTANGGVSFASGSIYNVAVSSTAASKLAVSGPAALAGSLTVTSTNGTYLLGQKVTVLTASNITGSFAYASTTFTGGNGALFKSTIAQTGTEVDLTIDLAKLSPVLPSTASGNQSRVIAGIDASLAAGNTLPVKVENLGNDSGTQLLSDSNQITGEISAELPAAARSLFAPFVEAMVSHTGKDELQAAGGHVSSWVNGLAGATTIASNADVGAHKFRSDADGIVMGASWAPWRNVMVGAALSVETSQFHLTGDLGKGHANAVQGGFYGYMQPSPHFYNSFVAGFSYAQIKTERVLTVSGTDDLTAKINAISFGGRYEAGLSLGAISPYVAAEDQLVMLPSYSEGAASGSNGFALQYASRTANAADVEIGLRHQVDVEITPRWILTPDWTLHLTDRLAWVHSFSDSASADANFLGAPASRFTVQGVQVGREAARASVGADFLFVNGFAVTSHVDATFSKQSESFAGFAGVGYKW
ncbi:MAG: autotransporter-associated beta strand repeat-containing protein [Rhizomicrobium sp.]|nr:autotransporter-associated beta strand repeat-containing protein [Rhizomicrobium sp.]